NSGPHCCDRYPVWRNRSAVEGACRRSYSRKCSDSARVCAGEVRASLSCRWSDYQQYTCQNCGGAWRATSYRFTNRICLSLEAPPTGAIANALHALTLLIARQLLNDLEHLDQKIDYFIVPPLCPLAGSPYDFSQTSLLIARAVESTSAWLAAGGLERPRVHKHLSLHKHSH